MSTEICPIMGAEATVEHGNWTSVASNAGIQYYLSEETYQDINDRGGIEKITSLDQVKISTHILELNIKNIIPKLKFEELEKISKKTELNVTERFNLFLKATKLYFPNIGENINLDVCSFLFSAAIGADTKETTSSEIYRMLVTYLENAVDKSYFNYDRAAYRAVLTLKGHQYIESLGHQLSDSDQIFVAMWFNDQTRPLYENAIKPAIKQAGYKVMRIDDKSHNEKICDEIIAEIRKSKALVADMTCGLAKPEEWSEENLVGAPRGGVFYEAGFAHGLGIPVIWTVNQEIADIENVSHFDVRQYNQIRWTKENLEEAKKEILNRIEATLGQGPHLEQN